MNKSFATYTPRVRPMVYDAIAGRSGCEPESGNAFFGLKAFEELCVANHDATSAVFNQPATVSYSIGPGNKGDPVTPYVTLWSVWVASAGVRVGKVGPVTPPANTLGDPSALYPTEKPTAITHGWNSEALLAIAIQKTPTAIELKRYDDTSGDIDTFTWTGVSPALFYSGLVVKDGRGQLVCYYLKPESPAVLYARFESDDFTEEQVVMPSLRVPLARLITVSSHDTKVLLYALDDRGRDVTLTSPRHEAFFTDAATLDVGLVDGQVFELGVTAGLVATDKAALDIGAPSGQVFSPLIDPAPPPPGDAMSLSVALVGGEVIA